MSASTRKKLRIIYPVFASKSLFPDDEVDVFISLAAEELEETVWKTRFERGVMALAAHMMEIARQQKALAAAIEEGGGGALAVGPIQSIKTGDLQTSYGSLGTALAEDDLKSLMTTPYGLEYIRLCGQVVSTPLSVGGT